MISISRMQEFLLDLAARVRKTYSGLAPRERIFVTAAGAVMLIVILDLAVVAPLSGRAQRLERQIEKARKDVAEMIALSEEHRRLEARLKGMKPVSQDFSIFHHLETVGTQSGVKIDSIKPGPAGSVGTLKEMTYDVRIDKVSLYQLVDLLYRLEKSREYPIQVKRISIRPQQRDRQFLEVSLQILMLASG